MKKSKLSSPPRFARRLLAWFCKPELLEDVEGDIAELFAERLEANHTKAKALYFLDVLLLFRPEIIKSIELKNGLINTAMLKNYLKIALRSALRYKGFTALNLVGLIVGLVSSMLILLWVQEEVMMDPMLVTTTATSMTAAMMMIMMRGRRSDLLYAA